MDTRKGVRATSVFFVAHSAVRKCEHILFGGPFRAQKSTHFCAVNGCALFSHNDCPYYLPLDGRKGERALSFATSVFFRGPLRPSENVSTDFFGGRLEHINETFNFCTGNVCALFSDIDCPYYLPIAYCI